MTSTSCTSPSEVSDRPQPRRRRALVMPLLVLGFFLAFEAMLRLTHFGAAALLAPWQYTPSEVAAMGLTRRPADPQVKRQLKPSMQTLFKGQQFTTNSAGFRDREFSRDRTPNVVRIAVMGTSIEMGSGVADDEIYSRRLQQKLDAVEPGRYEILNFAMSGSSFSQIVATYDRLVAQFHPDAVMLPLLARGPGGAEQREVRRQRPTYVHIMLDRLFAYRAMRQAAHDWTSSWLATDWLKRSTPGKPRQTVLTVLTPFFRARAQEGVAVFLLAYPSLAKKGGRRLDQRVDEARSWTGQFDHLHIIDMRKHLRDAITGSDYVFYGDMHPNARIHEELAAAIFAQWGTISATLPTPQRLADRGPES